MLSFFSSRPNWDSSTPSHAGEFVYPPLWFRGGGMHTCLQEKGGGVPIQTRAQTLQYDNLGKYVLYGPGRILLKYIFLITNGFRVTRCENSFSFWRTRIIVVKKSAKILRCPHSQSSKELSVPHFFYVSKHKPVDPSTFDF